ncbi:MAG: TIGR03905 family TSCPD domain-containing protein [Lachnospiraceae bacterium]|nr:TIGR03905 family TSCPD domain-containing protein [Lachnospiraceae bacterium]
MQYKTSGTCSQLIDFEVEDDIIKSVAFTGGCNGNLKGISALVSGMKVDDAIAKLKGIRCGLKNTSCPDQLARALEQYKAGTAN